MNRVNIFRDVCQVLGLTQIDNSWTKTLGLHLGLEQEVGDDYEQRVFVACFANGTSTNSGSVEIFDTFADFPTNGEDSTLYVTKDSNIIYRWDEVLSSYVILNDPDVVNPDAPEEGQTFYVRLATTSALRACTYNNGTAGVGATLTGNANGVLGEILFTTDRIDGVAAVLGDVILVKNQASALQNGIYEVTQLGSVSAPFILTRIAGYDQTAEIFPSVVFVSLGNNNRNRYFTQSTQNPTIGTSNLVFNVAANPSPALPVVFMSTVATDALSAGGGAATYTAGTVYPSLPGWGATLTSNSNMSLGAVNGVTLTSGMRIIVNGQSNQAHNGTYTVTNAGSATQRWVLTRWLSDSSQWHLGREFTVSNPTSTLYGSRWSVSSPLTMLNSQYGTTNIVFSQKNSVGLINGNGSIQLSAPNAIEVLTTSGEVVINSDLNDVNISTNTQNITIAAKNLLSLQSELDDVNITSVGGDVNITANGDILLGIDNSTNDFTVYTNEKNFNIGNVNGINNSQKAIRLYGGGNNQGSILISKGAYGLINDNDIVLSNTFGNIVLNTGSSVPTDKYIILSNLPLFDNDADAGTGGVPQNGVYKTTTGELRIKL